MDGECSLGKLKENFSPPPAVTKQIFQKMRMKGNVFPRLSFRLQKNTTVRQRIDFGFDENSHNKEGNFDMLCDVSSRLQLN